MKYFKGYEGRYSITKDGKVFSHLRGKFLTTVIGMTGYPQVTLHKNLTRKTFKIHRMVAETYIPNIHNKTQINHIDGNKANNNLSNLEWCTSKENIIHACDKKLKPSFTGSKNLKSKLTETEVLEIRKLHNPSKPMKYLAEKYNVSTDTIREIIKRKTWKHI